MEAATRQRLAQLERELATLRAQVGRQPRPRHTRAWFLGLALVALLALSPLGALAANFTDLNPGSPHNADINLIADAGISKGCGSTATYCPSDLVTREQMASFLARTAGLGANPPVANALTAVNATNALTAVNATTAQNATNATNATNAVNATTATNATQLGGIPASGYLQSGGALVYSFTPISIRSDDPLVTFAFTLGGTAQVGTTNTSATRRLFLPLDVPHTLFGVPLKVAAVEVCSFASGDPNPTITSSILFSVESVSSDQIAANSVTQTEGGCFTVEPNVPAAFEGGLVLVMFLSFPNTTATFNFMSITMTMTP